VVALGDATFKSSRTTGQPRGVVYAAVIQQWHDGQLTLEIVSSEWVIGMSVIRVCCVL